MVASANTITSGLNLTLAGANLTDNFRNAVLEFHLWVVQLSQITVVASSNGDGVTPVSGDNISTLADIVSATPGSNHTWIHYRHSSAEIDVILDVNDGAATPQEIEFYAVTTAQGYNSDGSQTNRPTPVSATDEWSRINVDLIPTGTLQPMTLHRIRSSSGEFVFGVSIDGTGDCETGIWLPITIGGDAPGNALPYAFYYNSSASGAFSRSVLGSGTNWRSHHIDATDVTNVDNVSPADAMGNWPNGQSAASGNPPVAPMDFVAGTSTQARYIGRSDDARAAPNNIAVNEVEDGDTDAIRRVTIDDTWFVVESSQLPLNL